jgi:mRNA interferase MazF
VQADHFAALPSLTVLPLTGEVHGEHLIRITVRPSRQNGLRQASQIMVDKISTIPRARTAKRIGKLEAGLLRVVEAALARFLALA